jgi:polysaccharide export outer membrane protein
MGGLRGFAAFSVVGAAMFAAGCGLISADGPNAIAVKAGATWNGPPYGLVYLTPRVVNILAEYGPATLSAVFSDNRPPPEIKLGIGDVVSVSIFEAAAGGLYIPAEASVRPGNFVALPNQSIDSHGNIFVPYAGQIPAAGKTPAQVDQEIVNRIKNRAIDPQAVVALVTQNSSLITVIGEINSATVASPTGRVVPQPSGERLLDVITRAGGLKDQGQDTWVVLERQGRRASAPFGSLQMRNKDVIFAANAQQVEITKFANFLNTLISVPTNGVLLANDLQTNRILFHTPNPTAAPPLVTTTP